MADIEHSPDCNVDGSNDLMIACTCQAERIAKLEEASEVMHEAIGEFARYGFGPFPWTSNQAYARNVLARVKEIMDE
jgi:hypothetical protein